MWLRRRFVCDNCSTRRLEDHPEFENKLTRCLARRLVADVRVMSGQAHIALWRSLLYNLVMYRSGLSRYRRFARPLSLVLISLSLVLLFADHALSQPSTPRVRRVYGDVSLDNVHSDNIAKLVKAGVFVGTACASNEFCPDQPLSRRTFAVWMVRVLDGDEAPDFVDPAVGGRSRFADVGADEREALFIERLAELGVTAGCKSEPLRYCPETSVSRAQMASFLSRAFQLPPAAEAGFADVSADNVHRDNINGLSASGITAGCKSEPKRYCPQQATTRAQMASFLARAMAWRDGEGSLQVDNPDEGQQPEETITVTGRDYSLQLRTSYDETAERATVGWRPSTDKPEQIDYYVLQWRRHWQDFGSDRQQTIDADDIVGGQYRFHIPDYAPHAVRVIIVRNDGTRLATAEVSSGSPHHRFYVLVRDRIINPYQDEYPWLKDTWDYINSFDFALVATSHDRTHVGYSGEPEGTTRLIDGLRPRYATSLYIPTGKLDYFDGWIPAMIHELGHVYTNSSLASTNPGPVGIGYLYLHLLTTNNTGVGPANFCGSNELYADLSQIVFLGDEFVSPAIGTLEGGGGYWAGCGLQLSQSDHDQALQDIPEIGRSVFIEQDMPDWLYDNYQLPGGDLDLETLWADIHSRREYRVTRQTISYHLRHEFGGYCSPEQVQQFIDGQITELRNPWRDGGCNN